MYNNGMSLTVSNLHRMPYILNRGRGKPSVAKFSELRKLREISIPRNFSTPINSPGSEIDIALLRVLIMQTADGNIINQPKSRDDVQIRINVKKNRKKSKQILKTLQSVYDHFKSF